MKDLPPSLAVTPNIPWEHQTIEQLEAERAYWDQQVREATCWGAGLVQADSYRRSCDAWLERRRQEAARPSSGERSEPG